MLSSQILNFGNYSIKPVEDTSYLIYQNLKNSSLFLLVTLQNQNPS